MRRKNAIPNEARHTPSLLPNHIINGIALTFHLKGQSSQVSIHARVASDAVADILQTTFEAANNVGYRLQDMRANIATVIESQKDIIKTYIKTFLDDALQKAAANAVAQMEEKLKETGKKQLKTATEGAVASLDKH